jgi:hypothetical protein
VGKQKFLNMSRWSDMIIASILWRIILFSVACLAVPYFSTFSNKRHDFREKILWNLKYDLIFSTNTV